eukprot:1525446-Prymnesium_polylepis.2
MRARGRQPARPRHSSAYPQEPHSDERRSLSLNALPGTSAAATRDPQARTVLHAPPAPCTSPSPGTSTTPRPGSSLPPH